MRNKLTGFVAALCMCSAVGTLTATPSYATDYFVKNIRETTAPTTIAQCPPTLTGATHGTVVFKRGPQTMFATVNLRNAKPGNYSAELYLHTTGGCSGVCDTSFTTDANGNATLHLQWPRGGIKSFFVFITGEGTGMPNYATGEVPNVGF